MKKEIEVKARVENLNVLKEKFERLGFIFDEPSFQEDVIFVNFDEDFLNPSQGVNFLRIRKTKGKIFFTLKQSVANELDCIEKEVEISDADEFKDVLMLMGYREAVSVEKTRMKAFLNELEICLDEVKGLGTFVEVEKIVEGDGSEIQEELFDFLESVDIKRENRVFQGYDTLMYKQLKKED